MTSSQQFEFLRKEISSIKRMLRTSVKSDKWIHEDDVVKNHRVSKRTLRRYRAEGKLKTVRVRIKGQGFEYLTSEIEKLFILI